MAASESTKSTGTIPISVYGPLKLYGIPTLLFEGEGPRPILRSRMKRGVEPALLSLPPTTEFISLIIVGAGGRDKIERGWGPLVRLEPPSYNPTPTPPAILKGVPER